MLKYLWPVRDSNSRPQQPCLALQDLLYLPMPYKDNPKKMDNAVHIVYWVLLNP